MGHAHEACDVKAITKIFPGQHAFKINMRTPHGSLIEADGPLTKDEFNTILAIIVGKKKKG